MFGVDILILLLLLLLLFLLLFLLYCLFGEKVVSNWLVDNLLLVLIINFYISVDAIGVNGLILNTLGFIDYNIG